MPLRRQRIWDCHFLQKTKRMRQPGRPHQAKYMYISLENQHGFGSSQNGVCLAGKSFPHPVAVFCTHLDLPKCHIMQKIVFGGVSAISSDIPYFPYYYYYLLGSSPSIICFMRFEPRPGPGPCLPTSKVEGDVVTRVRQVSPK